MNKLVHNVIWPAVAGNVLWAFLQVLADPPANGSVLFQRLASLLFFGCYLANDWIKRDAATSINENYWKYDLPLAASTATFAIATQGGLPWAPVALAAAFVVAAVGHCNGAWDPYDAPSNRKQRRALAGMNVGGLAILLIGWFLGAAVSPWSVPIAISVVVVLFVSLRNKIETL